MIKKLLLSFCTLEDCVLSSQNTLPLAYLHFERTAPSSQNSLLLDFQHFERAMFLDLKIIFLLSLGTGGGGYVPRSENIVSILFRYLRRVCIFYFS